MLRAKSISPPSWPAGIDEARKVQASLRGRVKTAPLRKRPEFLAGVDAAFTEDKVIGVACLYSYNDLVPLEDSHFILDITFPYVSGFLSFREGPAIIEALWRLKTTPDLVLFDGQGIAHPKGMGIASHIGVVIGIPTIGCAKSRLIGEFQEPGRKKGKWSPLRYQGRVVGAVLRTRDDVRPVFVSPGHRVDLADSIEIVLHCTDRYRLPEPIRRADRISKELKRRLTK